MIRVSRPAKGPAILDKQTPDADGVPRTENEHAIRHYTVGWNGETSYKWSRYSEDEVKKRLDELFGGKCAYCERLYAATQPVDVEHYRPKGEVKLSDEDADHHKPGYYWLGATWSNLLPSCIDCNRERWHLFQGVKAKGGKKNWFPIANPGHWDGTPGSDKADDRLLIDPCRDQPETHLEFLPDGQVISQKKGSGTSRKGRESIKVYGLNRPALIGAREARLLQIERDLQDAFNDAEVLAHLQEGPFKEEWREKVQDRIDRLKEYTDPKAEFAAMARQYLGALGLPTT